MTKRAIKKVDSLLGKHGMVYWATWADEIRSDTIYPEAIAARDAFFDKFCK